MRGPCVARATDQPPSRSSPRRAATRPRGVVWRRGGRRGGGAARPFLWPPPLPPLWVPQMQHPPPPPAGTPPAVTPPRTKKKLSPSRDRPASAQRMGVHPPVFTVEE